MTACENCGETGGVFDSRFGPLCHDCYQDAAIGEQPPEARLAEHPVTATWRDPKPSANGTDAERDKIVRQEKYGMRPAQR